MSKTNYDLLFNDYHILLAELKSEPRLRNNFVVISEDLSGLSKEQWGVIISHLHEKGIAKLILRNCGLVSIPPEIGQLTGLTSLNLNENQLTAIPAEIGQLTALTSLSLFRNQLTAIPAEIGQLTVLTLLNLKGNNIDGFDMTDSSNVIRRDSWKLFKAAAKLFLKERSTLLTPREVQNLYEATNKKVEPDVSEEVKNSFRNQQQLFFDFFLDLKGKEIKSENVTKELLDEFLNARGLGYDFTIEQVIMLAKKQTGEDDKERGKKRNQEQAGIGLP